MVGTVVRVEGLVDVPGLLQHARRRMLVPLGQLRVVHKVVDVALSLRQKDLPRDDGDQDGRDDRSLKRKVWNDATRRNCAIIFKSLETYADPHANGNDPSGNRLGHNVAVTVAVEGYRNEP